MCSALWTNAANSTGTRHGGRPTAASSAMPDPGLERPEVAQEVMVGGPERRDRVHERVGLDHEPRADRELRQRRGAASASRILDSRSWRGPGSSMHSAPSAGVYGLRIRRRIAAGADVTADILSGDAPAAGRPVRHLPPPARHPQHARLGVLALRALAHGPALSALPPAAGGRVRRLRAARTEPGSRHDARAARGRACWCSCLAGAGAAIVARRRRRRRRRRDRRRPRAGRWTPCAPPCSRAPRWRPRAWAASSTWSAASSSAAEARRRRSSATTSPRPLAARALDAGRAEPPGRRRLPRRRLRARRLHRPWRPARRGLLALPLRPRP